MVRDGSFHLLSFFALLAALLLLTGCGQSRTIDVTGLDRAIVGPIDMPICAFACFIEIAIETESENVTETINAGEDSEVDLGDINQEETGGTQSQSGVGIEGQLF